MNKTSLLVATTTDAPPVVADWSISDAIESLRERAAKLRDAAPSQAVAESWEFIREILADCVEDVRDEEQNIVREMNRGRSRPVPVPSSEWDNVS